MRKFMLLTSLLLTLAISFSAALTVNAGQKVLTVNQGDGNSTFTVTGEPTLVINGFDLSKAGVTLPATIDKVSISVDTPVQGAAATVVIYQDPNGGSPIDATLVTQAPANITASGIYTYTFPTPISVNSPVIWVGFYLPVNFKFNADKSGTSVLSYWAWSAGTTFDVARLNSAQVLGPSNGTPPVALNMLGTARITAEISSAGATVATPLPNTTPGAFTGSSQQIPYPDNADLSVLRWYPPACDTLAWDQADIGITFNGTLSVGCIAPSASYAPPNPTGYVRKQLYYEVTIYTDKGAVVTEPMGMPITHCVKPNPNDVNGAVIGVAWGVPKKWTIVPTVRVQDLVCAEIYQSSAISYFLPG